MAKKLLYLATVVFLVIAARGITWADTPIDHQVEQQRPIKLGTSGVNINDSSRRYCCGGTLGALVQDATGTQYILSNNHILARTNSALLGEQIIHPGLTDQHTPPDWNPVCYEDENDAVAYLSDFVPVRFKEGKFTPQNQVDAAIAEVVDGAVEPNGAILGIGVLSSETVKARPGQAVKKSGRTTGLTTGTVAAIHATVDVVYSTECGGPATNVARFKNQIFIKTNGFAGGGDSGSLIVEDVALEPRAVGLVFAGSSDGTLTVANSIDAVLNALGVAMAGAALPEPEASGAITGIVTNSADGSPVEAATVRVDTGELAVTDANGIYIITDVTVGNHLVKAYADGLKFRKKRAKVYEDEETILDFALKPHKGQEKPPRQPAIDPAPPRGWIDRAVKAKDRHEHNIFQIDDVVGTGVGLSETGEPVVEIYLKEDSAKARAQIPVALGNVPVEVLVTGPFEAF